MSIYVEILIRAPMEALWAHTQTPELHQRWDLRFSRIEYLPRETETQPQRFRYATRIGFGLEVAGEGESLGERDLASGSRFSALKFSSADSRSIIREGAGYWKYIPTADGITFLTWYDYRTRFGALGALLDRVGFRPLMGWATAWSFDRLRLWLEDGIDPTLAMRQGLELHLPARPRVRLQPAASPDPAPVRPLEHFERRRRRPRGHGGGVERRVAYSTVPVRRNLAPDHVS
jgi:hypothetical protein